MSKYLTGQEVIATLNIKDFELMELAKKGVLQPFTQSGMAVRNIQEKRILETSEEHRLYMLKLEKGAHETGKILVGSRSWGDTKSKNMKKQIELEAEIAKLERKGISPMSFGQIQERLSQYLPCIWKSYDLPMNESKAMELIRTFHDFIYLESEVEKLKIIETVNDISISRDDNMTWADITVTVLSDVELHFQWKNGSVTRTYDLLGFQNKKSGLPINAWKMLVKVAEKGQIPWAFKTRKQVEKIAQTLRKKFKALFPMVEGDPITINSASNVYEFSFKLKPQIE